MIDENNNSKIQEMEYDLLLFAICNVVVVVVVVVSGSIQSKNNTSTSTSINTIALSFWRLSIFIPRDISRDKNWYSLVTDFVFLLGSFSSDVPCLKMVNTNWYLLLEI
jgi:hypothetical protein